MSGITLDPAAREFAETTALPPYLFDLGPVAGRAVVDEIQGRPVAKHPVDMHDLVVPGGPYGPSWPAGHACGSGRQMFRFRRPRYARRAP